MRLSGKTTFVVGAGASAVYGLPTGAQLKKLLVAKLPSVLTRPKQGDLQEYGVNVAQLLQEADSFNRSGQASIDTYLERRSKFADAFKQAIASILLPQEYHAIQTARTSSDWLAWLFQQRHRDQDVVKFDGVEFVTFNYDRLIEGGIHQMTQHTYGVSVSEVPHLLLNLRIHHMYGNLGDGFPVYQRGQSPSFTNVEFQNASKSIHLMGDERNRAESAFAAAKSVIQKSENLVFLGFGFDETNLRRLGVHVDDPGWKPGAVKVFATMFGKADAEIDDVQAWIGGDQSNRWFGGPHEGCLDFLRRTVSFRTTPKR